MTTIKRFLIVVTILTLGLNQVLAERVSQEDAASVANNFMNATSSGSGAHKAPAKRMVLKKAPATTEEQQFYIYENADGEGWVMVAANDVVQPILAYSKTGQFNVNNQPSNVKVWLGGYNKQIKFAEENKVEATEEVKTAWRKLRTSPPVTAMGNVVVAPLIKTTWDQDDPYWKYCPKKGSTNTYVGCVATAMAQVMNYWKWPDQGEGSYSYTSDMNSLSCSADFGSTTYDWANMVDHYTTYYSGSSTISVSTPTTAQKNAVATLMYHCGVAVEMDYGTSNQGGSGAQTIYPNASQTNLKCAANALWNNFRYKESTLKCYYRPGGYGYSSVNDATWLNLLKTELNAARPIMYAGSDEEGGHSFVCDGYDDQNYFHFNWGWSGYCDGYYTVNNMVPGTGGSGAGNGSYNDDQDIIIGIIPDKPDVTITWSVQGNTTTTTQTTGTLVLPATTPSDCSGSGGKKFVGWTAQSTISNGARPSDLFTSGSGITVTGNKTYYAVYAAASGSGGGSSSGTKTFNFSSIASANSWANGVAYTEVEDSPVTITAEGGGNNGKWYTSGGGSWRMYSGGTVIISVTGGNVTSVTSSPACTFTITDGEASYSPSARTDYTSITVNYTVSGGGTSYSDYSLTCSAPEPCSNQVNLTKGSPSNGTFSLDKANGAYDNCSAGGLVVTVSDITPAEGYEFGAITQTGIASGVTIDQAGKTVTYAKDVTGSSTINVTFTPKTTYAIRFFNNGEQVGATQNLYAGQTAVKPSPDPTACTGYTFVGWWTAALATNNTTAETWVTDFTVTGAQDYYAVYSQTTGGGGSSSGTKTFAFSSIATTEGWENGVAYTEVEDSPVTITAEGGGNNGKWYTSGGGSWRMYSGGTVIITVSGGEVTSVTSSPASTFTITNGEASYSPSARTDYTSITVNYTVGGGGTTYYTTTAECDECTNKVTLEKGTPSNGTFSLDKANGAYDNCSAGGLVVTVSDITPAEGYEFGAITQTGIASGVTIDQAGKTVTYAKDVTGSSTINVTFTPKTTYAIRFFNNGEQVGATQNLYAGQTAVKPSPDPTACTGYTFVGWWTAELAEDNTTAETWVTDFTVTGAQDYYAVYSRTTGGGGSSSGTKTFSFSSIASSEGWENGVAYTEVEDSPVTITAEGGGNNGKWYTSGGGSWRMYSGGTVIISVTGGNVTSVTSSPACTFTITDGEASYSPGARTDFTSITVNYTVSGGGTTYYTTTADCIECLNKVTIEKGEENNGTFSLDKNGTYDNCKTGGLVVHVTDIAPSEDYQFAEITQTGIASGVTIDNDAKTITYDKDVTGSSTINVVFEPKPSYTIRFYNNESLIGSEQTVVSGKTPIVPSNPEACEGYTFVGWWTTALPASNTESHIWVTDFTATGNRDYYAIYRHNEGGSGSGTESVTFSDIYTSNTIVEDISIAIGTHTSVTFTKGGSDTQYYTNGDAIRWYGGGTCVVVSDAGNITGITFTFGSSDGSNEIEAEGYVEPTWTGEASSVTFTQSGTSGNRRIAGISVTVDGGGTAHYTSVFSCSGHTITVAEVEHGSGVSDKSRCDEGGTVTITMTADEGYECGGITTAPDVSVTEASECTYTFLMPDEDITVTPVFTPKTPRTFTFEKGTGICETSSLTEAVWNGGVTLPVATANSGCDPEYVFAGWAIAAVTTETEVRPTLYAAGTLYNEEETTLYAVYSQTTGGNASGFTLSYTYNDVTYYVTARTGTNSYMGASTDETEAARFTIVTSNDKKYLCWHGEHDTYVHNSADNTTLKFTTELASASDWTVTEEGTSITLRNSTSGRYFMFNTNQKDRFSSYASEGSLTKGDAGTTVYNTSPSCICYSVNITYDANGGTLAEGCGNVVGGECERDWKLCEAPTRDGYLFTNWKDQNGTLYNAGAMVQDLKLSLTLTAQWIEAPYTVLFDAGTGTCVASLTEPSRGDGITLPKAEPSAACAEDWTFIGWSETALVGETNTTASIIGVAGTPYTPASNNVTLYAVYSSLDEGGATTDYTRVTASTPEEGDYVIVVAKSDASFGLVTYGTASGGRLAYTEAYTSLPTTTISTPTATQIWHLTYNPEGYAYLYNANAGAYLAASGTNITFNANAGSAFVLTRNAGTYGDYECLNNTASESKDYYLGVNKDYDFIRYYASQTLNAVNSVTLYKGSTGTRYYATSSECTPCTDPEWSFELGTSVVKTKGSEPFTNTVVKGHESLGTVTYSSTNEAVATVDATGLVTMHETGITTITLRLTKAMPYCAAVLQYELEVKEPSIDIVGVTPDGEIIIEHDLEGTITLDLSEGNAISTGTAANDLFFSKYFEAASNMKLFAIFNGTGHEMDLSNIRVRCNCTTDGKWPKKTGDLGYVELRTISKLREQYPKMKIPSGTELIFWSNNTTTAPEGNTKLRNCISVKIGDMTYTYSDMEAMEIPNWFCLGNHTTYNVIDADGNNQFIFNGDDSMILERYNPATGQWEAIDIFGAGTSAAPASTAGLVEKITTNYEINGSLQPLNDDPGFHALCEGSTIPLSTNRYMLVRKNSVLDGMHAVASNTSSFSTLCEEWHGTPVGGAKDDAAFCHSGEIFSDIAEYDYAENYIDWDEITDDDYEVEEKENGTTTITFKDPNNLDERACSLLKIEVRDKDDASKILATTEYKIPIVVKAGTHMTTEELFYHQGEKCATCDVAILGSAVLTKADDEAGNDMPEVRDIYVYGGGKLVIPAETHYRAHNLIMRMQMADDKVNVNVPNVKVDGSLTNQYGGEIRQQVRVGTSRFYQFAVPYPVRLEDVTFSDGTPAVYGEDFMIRYYDGESRAQNLGTASNWRNFEGTQLLPGVGYTLAVAKKAGHEQRELVFPMSDASLNDGEPVSKATTIHAWGDNSIRANHRGWNFLSNPYLTTYAKNYLNEDAGGMLTTGRLVDDPEHPGWWVSDNGTVPYVTLINGTRTDYDQELVSLSELPPFTTFFIQAGDDDHHSGDEFSLTFSREHRKNAAPAYIRAEQKSPVARFGVLLSGNNAKDNCGVAIGEDYSAAYDMQADLSKEFGSAYSLKLYTLQEDEMRMAFLATHPDSLSKPIPVGVRLPANAEYTFAVDRRYNLGAFAHIYLTDNVTGQHVDLLDDTYTFTGSRQQNDARFSLFAELQKETPTDIQNLLNGVYAVGREGSLLLTGLPESADIYIYDMSGRMVQTGHTQGAASVTYSLPTGVYQIRVLSEGANALLRTIVY